MDTGVEVIGLAELRKALKALEPAEALKETRLGLKAAAGIVAKDAKNRASGFSGRAAATIRPVSGGNIAYVAGGKAKLPWYGWADFGSRNPKSGQSRSVGPWTRSGKGPTGGRFIYPALAATKSEVSEAVADALDHAFRRLGF